VFRQSYSLNPRFFFFFEISIADIFLNRPCVDLAPPIIHGHLMGAVSFLARPRIAFDTRFASFFSAVSRERTPILSPGTKRPKRRGWRFSASSFGVSVFRLFFSLLDIILIMMVEPVVTGSLLISFGFGGESTLLILEAKTSSTWQDLLLASASEVPLGDEEPVPKYNPTNPRGGGGVWVGGGGGGGGVVWGGGGVVFFFFGGGGGFFSFFFFFGVVGGGGGISCVFFFFPMFL